MPFRSRTYCVVTLGVAVWLAGRVAAYADDKAWLVADIVAGLSDADPQNRVAAASRAMNAKDDRLLGVLVRALSDTDTEVRKRAASAIASTPGDRAGQVAIRHLSHADPVVRLSLRRRFVIPQKLPDELLPALLAGLEDSDNTVRDYTAAAIRRMPGDAATAVMVKLLDHEDPALRKQAIYRLREHPTADAVRLLAKRLDDPDNATQLLAAATLRGLRAEGVADVMLAALKHAAPTVRRQAAAYFVADPQPRALAALLTALKDLDNETRGHAANALRKLDDARAAAALKKFPQRQQRKPDIEALFGKSPSPQTLKMLLQHRDGTVRHRAIQLLRAVKDDSTVKVALAALRHPDPVVRHQAAARFIEAPDGAAVPALKNALDDADSEVRKHAAHALRRTPGDAAAKVSLAALRHKDPRVRHHASYRFVEMPDAAAVPALRNALQDLSTDVRKHAAYALRKTPGDEATQAAVEMLNHPDPGVRYHASYRFVDFPDAAFVPALVRSLSDSDSTVRRHAALALRKTSGDAAVSACLATFRHADPAVRRNVVYRFAELPDSRASAKLIAALNDEDREVRLNAISSLAVSGDANAITALLRLIDNQDADLRHRAGNAVKTLAVRFRDTQTATRSPFRSQDVEAALNPLPSRRIATPAACVELLGGERITGNVVKFVAGSNVATGGLPPHFVIALRDLSVASASLSSPQHSGEARVLTRWIRRVVWRRPRGSGHDQPGTALLNNGQRLPFRALRWNENGAVLLAATGTHHVEFHDLAELHLPQSDPWPAYFEQLAMSGTGAADPILQLVVRDGSRVRTAASRFALFADTTAGDPREWRHVFQPAWSLDLLSVQQDRLWLRSHNPATLVPMFLPFDYEPKTDSFFTWQVNHNVHGDPAVTGNQHSRWGFGVHADNVLRFTLPGLSANFETHVGLDHCVHHGGCARAIVRLRTKDQVKDLYTSPLLIGSNKAHATGSLDLPAASPETRLELVADSAHADRPRGADPLDIRDSLNWMEPRFQLDSAELQETIAGQASQLIASQTGWHLQAGERGSVGLANLWWNHRGTPTYVLVVKQAPVTISRIVSAGQRANQLLLNVWRTGAAPTAPRIEVRINGGPVGVFEIPPYQPNHLLTPIAVPMNVAGGEDLTITVRHLDAAPDGIFWEHSGLDHDLPSPLALFEDAANLERADDGNAGEVALVDDVAYSGKRAIQLTPGGHFEVAFRQPLKIREQPGDDAVRFLRFAFRKTGGGLVSLALRRPAPDALPIRYDAGAGEAAAGPAKHIWPAGIPDEWVVAEVDLFADWGETEVDALVLGTTGGQAALIDCVYLARSRQDFGRIAVSFPPAEANFRARRALSQPVLDITRQAIVGIEIAGRRGTGVLIGDEGLVLTAASVAGAVGGDASVLLSDSRTAKGTVTRINPKANCGIIKLNEKPELAGTKLSQRPKLPPIGLYIGFSFSAQYFNAEQPQSYLTMIVGAADDTFQTDYQVPGAWPGGPLFDRNAEVVGVHLGGTQFAAVQQFSDWVEQR